MNYPIINGFKVDLNQEFIENKVIDELYTLDDNQNVLVPRYAPFFVNSLSVTALDGTPLDKTDYRIFRMMGALSALTASPVACLIEITNPTIKNVLLTYHQTGKSSLFDASFIEMINNAANDDRMVKWGNIKHKPVVFDPILHTHSLTYEITTFKDVVDMINQWTDYIKQTSVNNGLVALETQTKIIKNYFDRNGAIIDYLLSRHVNAVDAHGLTKAQIGKGLVDNIPTSTLAEGLRGAPNQRLTPYVLGALLDRYGVIDDAYVKANTLPISFYGNTSFIPPTIGGSFEGLGSISEAGVFCTESDGTISYLSNRFDGRTTGLYFSILNGYPNNVVCSYQSYRYNHSVLTTAGVIPNTIAQSEGREIMMVGGSNRWFIALTNGTLNPAYHQMVEVDLTMLSPNFLTDQNLSIHLMGNYIIIVQAFMPDASVALNISAKAFYRIPVSALSQGTKVVPTRMNLTYTNNDGDTFNNVDTFYWARLKKDGNGNLINAWLNFNPPLTGVRENPIYGTQLAFCKQSTVNPSRWLFKFTAPMLFNMVNASGSYGFTFNPESNYEFDPNTGVMTQIDYLAPPTINPNLDANPQQAINDYYKVVPGGIPWPNWYNVRSGWTLLPDGNMLVSITYNNISIPHRILVIKTGAKSAYDAIAKRFSALNYPNFVATTVTEIITGPLLSSTLSNSVTYDINGELYNAVGQSSDSDQALYHRDVSGEYALRDSFTNLYVGNILSRPLSNSIRKTNVSNLTPRVNLTGDANAISAFGIVGLGLTVWSVGIQGKYWINNNSGWRVPPKDESVVMPIGMNVSIAGDNSLVYTPTGYITYPKPIVDSIAQQIIPPQYRNSPNYAAVITDLTFVNNNNIGFKPVIVQVIYGDVANKTRRVAVAVLNVNYSTQGNDRTVTSFAVAGMADVVDTVVQDYLTSTSYPFAYTSVGQTENVCNVYYNGNTLSVANNTYLYTSNVGGASFCGADFDINMQNKGISRITPYTQAYNGGANISYVPKLGKGLKYDLTISGGTANIVLVGTQPVGLSSCYPDPAWTAFFQSTTTPMFNGKTYTLPAGLIDLRTVKANPGNSTFYIYAAVKVGVAVYDISETKRVDTPFNIWIGTIVTNANQIINIDRFNVLLLNGKRVSETKRGGAIPAVTSGVNDTGTMHWIRPPELIQQ